MSTNIQYQNEVMKREYFQFLTDSKGFQQLSIDEHEKAIWLWQDFTSNADFRTFSKKKATEFRDWLKAKKKTHNTNIKVSLTHCYHMLRHLRVFFDWLAKQPTYKSKIVASDIDYLGLNRADTRIATQKERKESPSIEQVKTVIEGIQSNSEIGMRDRALISLFYLTGARISAVCSLPLGCLDEVKLILDQDPKRGVKTKNRKRIPTRFFPLPYTQPLDYVVNWVKYLKDKKGFSPDDPLFPATLRYQTGDKKLAFSSQMVGNEFWKTTASARKILQKRFEEVGLPYYNPHSFRDTIVKEYTRTRLTEEEKKAISQNLGHENVGTTFGSYGHGKLPEDRQFEIIESINTQQDTLSTSPLDEETLRRIIREETGKQK